MPDLLDLINSGGSLAETVSPLRPNPGLDRMLAEEQERERRRRMAAVLAAQAGMDPPPLPGSPQARPAVMRSTDPPGTVKNGVFRSTDPRPTLQPVTDGPQAMMRAAVAAGRPLPSDAELVAALPPVEAPRPPRPGSSAPPVNPLIASIMGGGPQAAQPSLVAPDARSGPMRDPRGRPLYGDERDGLLMGRRGANDRSEALRDLMRNRDAPIPEMPASLTGPEYPDFAEMVATGFAGPKAEAMRRRDRAGDRANPTGRGWVTDPETGHTRRQLYSEIDPQRRARHLGYDRNGQRYRYMPPLESGGGGQAMASVPSMPQIRPGGFEGTGAPDSSHGNDGVGGLVSYIRRPPEGRSAEAQAVLDEARARYKAREKEREAEVETFREKKAVKDDYYRKLYSVPAQDRAGIIAAEIQAEAMGKRYGQENEQTQFENGLKGGLARGSLISTYMEANPNATPEEAEAFADRNLGPARGAIPGTVGAGPRLPARPRPGDDGTIATPALRQYIDELPDDLAGVSPDMLPPTDTLVTLYGELSRPESTFWGEDPLVKAQRERLKEKAARALRLKGIRVPEEESRSLAIAPPVAVPGIPGTRLPIGGNGRPGAPSIGFR